MYGARRLCIGQRKQPSGRGRRRTGYRAGFQRRSKTPLLCARPLVSGVYGLILSALSRTTLQASIRIFVTWLSSTATLLRQLLHSTGLMRMLGFLEYGKGQDLHKGLNVLNCTRELLDPPRTLSDDWLSSRERTGKITRPTSVRGTLPYRLRKDSSRQSLIDIDPDADLLYPEPIPTHVTSGMVAHPPSLKHIFAMSPWNSRGWTLQERLLSRRCIYFSREYVYFQCAEHTLCETGGDLHTWADVQNADSNAAEVTRAQETNPMLRYRKPAPTHSVKFENEHSHATLLRQDFDAYADLVEMYSRRNLSFNADILNAATGMLSVLQYRLGRTLSGISSTYLDLALMWNPAEPHDRMTPIGAGGNAFPTWSWTSWTGRKQYRLTETVAALSIRWIINAPAQR